MKLRLKYNKILDSYYIEENYGFFFWSHVQGPSFTIEPRPNSDKKLVFPDLPRPSMPTFDGGWYFKNYDIALQGMRDMLTECEKANAKAKAHKITKMETKC